jgi:outer membrane lipoprotein-sorting protein
MDESGQVKRVDITIDYMGRNGTWHQVFHELILKFDSPFKRHYTFPQETYVIRNGKIVYQRKDPDFAEYDDHNWYAH